MNVLSTSRAAKNKQFYITYRTVVVIYNSRNGRFLASLLNNLVSVIQQHTASLHRL